ncbi:hypothetical protein EYF80_043247 [Liparis tanakae]|uniref:Uncharacterized protein n=1 Tax=Liparis tanakae TaxID=230148 RepID=A0A4Z2G0Z5_9TELE|nr:hypothetical protein EYF80_043247 [Liparis tanakae]
MKSVEVFTQRGMGGPGRVLLVQAGHKTVQGGRRGIRQRPSVHVRWTPSLWGRGAGSQSQRGNSLGYDDFLKHTGRTEQAGIGVGGSGPVLHGAERAGRPSAQSQSRRTEVSNGTRGGPYGTFN